MSHENRNKMHEKRSKMSAFLMGAAAGGIAVLLMAPSSGAEVRRRLRGRSKALYARGSEKAERATASMREIKDRKLSRLRRRREEILG